MERASEQELKMVDKEGLIAGSGKGIQRMIKTALQGRWISTSETVDKIRRKDVMGELKSWIHNGA